MTAFDVDIHQRAEIIIAGILIDKEGKEFACDEPGCGWMIGEDANDNLVVEVAALPHKVFYEIIVVFRKVTRSRGASNVPSGKSSGGSKDILLRIVGDTYREEFHEFARVVLIGRVFMAFGQVQIEEHGRVGGDAE